MYVSLVLIHFGENCNKIIKLNFTYFSSNGNGAGN